MKNLTVVCQQLSQLRFVIIFVFGRTVKLGVSVSRGEIEAEFQSVTAACVGKLSDNIAFAVLYGLFFMH